MGFLHGLSIAMGANAILFVLSFLNNKLIYLYLSPDQNGVFFLIMRYSMLVALVFGEWLRLTNVNIAGVSKSLTRTLAANILVYVLLVIFVLVSVFVLFPGASERIFPGVPVVFFGAILAAGICLMIRNLFQSLLLVNNRMFHYGFAFVLWGSVFLLFDILFVIILHRELDAVVAVFVVSSAAAALWALGSTIRFHGFAWRPSRSVFGRSCRLGVRAAIAVIGMFLMLNVHTFVLEPFARDTGRGLAMVALFSVCFRIYQLFQRGADVIGTILFPTVAQQEAQTGFRTTILVCRNLFWGMVFATIIGGIFGKLIIHIVSDVTYLDAYRPLLVMLPGIVMVTTGSLFNTAYWAQNYPFKVILAPYFATAFGLLLNMVFIPRFGVIGATASFTLMSAVWFLYIILVFKHDSHYRFSELLIPRLADIRYVYGRIKTFKARWR